MLAFMCMDQCSGKNFIDKFFSFKFTKQKTIKSCCVAQSRSRISVRQFLFA